ncbi:uncharacterized protein F5891DRAFT_1194099 [Suillus fuscotomentosus]|uniref:Fungal-type protein kinase domain-containing protein n=1 Tax=Suillus fuscotomentosus TaxID=1912939 RepID=A0AAD4DXQ3_9AGAM|nr:uncharacterized protein F5891DRAFT_1194099 [Suillus fuscotomentosus]KAG1895577.1 hypothetical protein F5891DRAFT_1194099 [Suillus fuscotomentosus]
MDRLTSSELIHLILQESSPANSDELGHVLSLIFKSCTTEVPKAKDLKVLLKKIHPDTRIKAFQHIEDEATLVPLYDTRACRWNWPLPESHLDKLATSGERSSNQAGENSSTDQGEREGENSGATNQRSGDWVIVDDTDAPAGSESQVESVGQPEDDVMSTNASSASSDKAPVLHEIDRDSTKPWMTEQVFASFNNLLTFALLLQKPALAQKRNLSRIWSASNSSSAIHGDEIAHKPDLTLLDDIEARWDTIKAVCELTSSAYLPSHPLAKTLDTKAYLLLKHQPWRRFALLVSICNGYHELRVHLYDHSGGVVSPCTHIDQEPDKYLRIFSSIVFGNLECIGLDPTITILRHTLHRTLRSPDFRVAKPSPSPHQTAEVIPDALIMESETTEIEEIVSELPHTIEDAVPNPAANIPPNLVPLIDEVPSDSLSEPLPEPIGKIQVNENTYNILDLIFSTQGLVGRGTVCYLARKDEEEYIVKDHWVLGSKSEVLNEIRMMEKMDGIRGVPRLVEYWLVEMEPGEVDETVKYRQKVPCSIKGTSRMHVCLVLKPRTRPLYEFHSRAEFLTSILDIIKIQKQAVEQNRVLHRDCSLNNAMIEDDGDGTHGMLIDWEFAVEIVRGNQAQYLSCRSPFSSSFMYLHTPDPSDERLGTRASGSKPYPPPMVTHVYQDDLESMFYVFIWVCIEFRDPLGMKRVLPTILPQYSLQRVKWITQEWSASTYQKCGDSKTQFFHQSEHYTKELSRQFDPYFESLLPLALEWYDLVKNPDRLLFDNVIDLLGRHIAALPKEDSAGLLVSKWVILSAAGSLTPPQNNEESASPPVDETRQKRVVDHRWMMEAIPKPKRNKTRE